MKNHKIKIPIVLWLKLIKQLCIRGHKKRESGAFLLGSRTNNKIKNFICYDDLDPSSLDKGYINFSGNGYIPLWNYCIKNNLSVLADIHTHPGIWTGQSELDKKNPMVSQLGHVALIVPKFAANRFQFLNGVGIYEYLGNYSWKNSNKIKLTTI